MIYLFIGDDTKNKIRSYEEFLNSLSKEMEVFYVSKKDFYPDQIESFYSGSGLFFSKCTVVFSDIFDLESAGEFLLKKLPFLSESKNNFVFWEGKLNKSILDAFKKAQAKLNIFELSKEKKEKFNNFLLADAFYNKDKLNLWIYFRQAIDLGVGMEELTGVLIWKAKDMIINKNFKKFEENELKNFATKLTYLLPKARKEGKDDEAVFEKFLLEAF